MFCVSSAIKYSENYYEYEATKGDDLPRLDVGSGGKWCGGGGVLRANKRLSSKDQGGLKWRRAACLHLVLWAFYLLQSSTSETTHYKLLSLKQRSDKYTYCSHGWFIYETHDV